MVTENESVERKIDHKTVVITEVGEKELTFFAQDCEKGCLFRCRHLYRSKFEINCTEMNTDAVAGPQLEKMMEQLRLDMTSSPPLPGAYTPRRGEMCVAKYSDGEW